MSKSDILENESNVQDYESDDPDNSELELDAYPR